MHEGFGLFFPELRLTVRPKNALQKIKFRTIPFVLRLVVLLTPSLFMFMWLCNHVFEIIHD